MSENEKDRDFEFIKEQVIVKKHKKFKKWFVPFCMTIFMAVLFGLIAAVTFCLAEPRLLKFLHREEENKTSVSFPTQNPDEPSTEGNTDEPDVPANDITQVPEEEVVQTVPEETDTNKPDTVIIKTTIDADIDDYLKMHDEIKSIVYEANKSVVTVSSINNIEDLFGNPIELKVETTGVVVYNNNVALLILVSLDRVQKANSIQIELVDKVSVEAELQDFDKELNLAVLAVKLKNIPQLYRNRIKVAPLGESDTIAVGNPIIALGSPNGHPNSMEIGMVTSKGSEISVTDNRLDLFNTDIVDNENSDGVIINMRGEVIGLITRTLKEGINEEINTAIGISKLKLLIERMVNQEPILYCGIITEELTEEAKADHQVDSGIFVNEVIANSPAFDCGIKNGDIILQIDDATVLNSNNFYNIISSYQPEDKIKIKILRTSKTTEKEIELEITLVEKEK